jgi:ferredoxin
MRGGRERERKRRTPTPSPFSSSQVDDDAQVGAIKAAYRALAKSCHPDVHADGHDLCILLNEAYETLADDRARAAYNATLQAALDAAADGYTGEPLSKWMAGKSRGRAVAGETRAVYVDELACIGCQNCIFEAAATFRVEKTHGRARVFAQWIDPEEKIQRSIDSCPVSCIHWVDKGDLPALEHVTQRVLTERRGVAAMMAGQGAAAADPFAATAKWVKDRERAAEARAAAAAREAAASPARQAARAAAADAVRREQYGAFAGFASVLDAALGGLGAADYGPPSGGSASSSSYASSSASDSEGATVGARRRAGRRARAPANAGGGIVPDDRALVLAPRDTDT